MRSKGIVWCTLVVLATVFAVSGSALAASVLLNWVDESSNETGFKIERMPAGGSYIVLATVGSNVQTYTDTNVLAGSSYCYRISAHNSYGTSAPSNSACTQIPTSSPTASGSDTPSSSDTTTSSGTTSESPKPGKGRKARRVASTSSTSSTSGTTTAETLAPSGPDTSWTDYRITMNIISKDNGTIGVMFRYFDNDNYYRFTWNSYNSSRRLEKKHNGTFQLLAEDAIPYVRNKNYQLEISAKDSTLEVKIDGEAVFSVEDATIGSGSIALYSWLNRGSIFDNVLVEDLNTGAVLLLDDFDDGDLKEWTIFDEATSGEASIWTVINGMAVQSSNVGSRTTGAPGSFALYY